MGALFAVVGLTGSTLVFYTAIDAGLHPRVRGEARAPDLASPAWDRALETGRGRWHDAKGKWTFEVTDSGAIPARYYPAPGRHADRLMVWFSPGGERVVRAEPWGGYLMSWLYQLHMQLLAGEVGGQVVGWAGVAMLLLLASGLFAWWPRGSWRKALSFKREAAPLRRLRDLHKVGGLWSMALLAVLTATGILLALPPVTQALLRPAPLPVPLSADAAPGRVTIAQAFAAARRLFPDGRIVFVDVPTPRAAAIRVRLQLPGDPHPRFPSSYVWIDQQSGRVLAVRDVRSAGSGAAAASWIRTLHDGSVGGLTTRVLAMLLGMAPAVLFTTGVLHWRRRRAGRG